MSRPLAVKAISSATRASPPPDRTRPPKKPSSRPRAARSFEPRLSGGSRNGRNEVASILDFIRAGDVLIVVKLDRLGRNTDVLNLVHDLEEKGASLRVLEPAIDTGGPMGRMVLTVLGMVAEMELGFIRDRQRAGIDAAKAKGIYKGRPVTFDRARIVSLRKEGMGATEIAKAVGCKRGNVYKALKAAGLN
jgi:DNA invertase Pin-like site-specific DNA recombinase